MVSVRSQNTFNCCRLKVYKILEKFNNADIEWWRHDDEKVGIIVGYWFYAAE